MCSYAVQSQSQYHLTNYLTENFVFPDGSETTNSEIAMNCNTYPRQGGAGLERVKLFCIIFFYTFILSFGT